MSKEVTENRFRFGRMVKSAAPTADVVQQILEQRNAVRDANAEDDNDATAPEFAITPESDALKIALEPQSQQIEQVADGLSQLFDLLVAFREQDAAENKAFDTMHAELSDYKKDFFYERLKPFARQLLFVCDALEQYGEEIAGAAAHNKMLPAANVKINVAHCADQLKDALALIEITPIEANGAEFDPKTQRAIEVETVPAQRDKAVVRQVRAGWTMGGNLLRPADVVVGKAD